MQNKILTAISLLFTVLLTFVLCIGAFTEANEEAVFAALRANSQYSLAGAQYQLYTDKGCTTPAKDAAGNNAIFTTDASGNTGTIEIEQGTYYAKEIKASPGYRTDPEVSGPIEIGDGNKQSNPAGFTSKEPPAYGLPDFTLFKVDKSGKYGWKALTGAEYTIRYYDVADRDEIDDSHLMKTWTFKTVKTSFDKENGICYAGFDWQTDDPVAGSDDFYIADGKRVMPLGWFTVQETDAPNGLALSSEVFYGQVYQPASGADAKTVINGADPDGNLMTRIYANEEPQAVTVSVDKQKAQSGIDEKLLSTASLAGAVYEVYYDDDDKPRPELVGTINTDENGHGSLTKREAGDERKLGDPLDAGDYIIREVNASPGFLIDRYVLAGSNTEELKGETEVTVAYEADGSPVTRQINGSYKDGGHIFKARLQGKNIPLFEYTVTSKEYATETHIKKTDATTTKEIPGAKLQILKGGKVIEEWVSTQKEHIVYGLESGTYTLREITAPYGYDIAEDISFTVSDSKVVTKVEMKNKPVKVNTSASDAITDAHHGTRNGFELVKDEVTVTGLFKGRKYQITGKLWNKAKEQFVKDADGNDLTVRSEEFTAKGDKETIELSFYVDSSEFTEDVSLVAFEYLSRTERIEGRDQTNDFPGDNLPKELGKHEDAGDKNQTVSYGGIAETEALDADGESHEVHANRRAVVTDNVRYENLSTLDEYTIDGELYDKTDQKLTGIKGSTVFRPESADGYTEVEFSFNASEYEGHRLVAYEVLSINGTEVCRHENPEDEDQTVDITEPDEVSFTGRVETGDKTAIGLLAAVFTASASLLMLLARHSIRRKDDNDLLV